MAAVVAGGWQVLVAGSPFPAPVEQVEVAVPEGDGLAELATLGERDPAQASRLRALTDPDRARCTPEPCEVWRVAVRGEQAWDLQVHEGRLAVVDGDDVVVLDVLSGSELVRTRVTGEGAVTGDGDAIAGAERLRYAVALDDGFVAAVGRHLQAIADDGTVRWTVEEHGHNPGHLRVVADRLLLDGASGTDGRSQVRLLDVDTGATLLETDGMAVSWSEPGDDLLLVWDDTGLDARALALDIRSAEVLWDRPLASASSFPIELGDHVLLHAEPGQRHDGLGADALPPSELVHLRTGEVARTFEDAVVGMTLSDAGPVVATVAPAAAEALHGVGERAAGSSLGLELTVHFLDTSGALRGAPTLTVDTAVGHGVDLAADADGVRVWTRDDPILVAPDGTVGSVADTEPLAGGWLDPTTGLVLGWRGTSFAISTPDGAGVELTGSFFGILGRYDDVVVVAMEREVLGVRLVQDDP